MLSAGWSGREEASQEARKQHDDENIFPCILTRKAPQMCCVALTGSSGSPCIIGEVEIEYS